jgi:hypothetical protein
MPSMRSKTYEPESIAEPIVAAEPIVVPVAPVTLDPLDRARALADEARLVAAAIGPGFPRVAVILNDAAYSIEQELQRDHALRP